MKINTGDYTDITPASPFMMKLLEGIIKSNKYKKLIDSGFVPEFSLKEVPIAIVVKPAMCSGGHPLYNLTHLCLHQECEGSKRIVYAD